MNSPNLHWISSDSPPDAFPPVGNALLEPDGLLAAGGDLSEARLLHAYSQGIFPWYNEGEPILWWSPNPRCVLYPQKIHLSRRFRRTLRRTPTSITFNRHFDSVLAACAAPRGEHAGTWITDAMARAYQRLHDSGWAHSVEVWQNDQLIGGLYGLAIGQVFFGESMFSHQTNGSKVALMGLCALMNRQGLTLLDCQVASPHLLSLGAELLERREFVTLLSRHCDRRRVSDWPDQAQPAERLLVG